MLYLAVNRYGQPYKQYRAEEIVEKDFDIFVQPHLIGKNTASLQTASKIILGIDPGTLLMGYGIIEICNNTITLKEMDVLKLSGKKDNHERLQLIHQKIVCLIEQHRPDEFAIEAPFFGKNVQSMLKLGRAQGCWTRMARIGQCRESPPA